MFYAGLAIHHIILKSKGSDNISSNLMILHINCYKQIHSLRLKHKSAFKFMLYNITLLTLKLSQ
ncbi:HNH endonuclease [Orientia tsutsugamushi]|uniref:HNH endonuclease n=1 Tax=Orientia tsutsugamushi TaxID=784 RepID=UPI003527345B